jgi:hypothetical protein
MDFCAEYITRNYVRQSNVVRLVCLNSLIRKYFLIRYTDETM